MAVGYAAGSDRGRNRIARAVSLSRTRGAVQLAAHMAAEIDDRLAGKSAGSALALFTAQDHVTPAFTRNTSFWAADIVAKLTCISPSNSTLDNNGAGVAITPRHVLYCKHGGVGVGYPADAASIRFVTTDNTVVMRTQSSHLELSVDMAIGLLDSDLPATITPCKTAPDSLRSYLSSFPYVPVMVLDQEEKGVVKDIDHIDAVSGLWTRTPTDTQRLAFHEALVAGDSGDPVFGIINDELVLLGVVKDVNEMMSTVGSNTIIAAGITTIGANGHALSNPSLAGFATVR